MVRMLALLPALTLLVACPPVEEGCTMEARSSLTITVVDADGAPIDPASATFSVDGGAVEPCEQLFANTIVCGYERAGHFDVVVSADGFLDAPLSVDVVEGECHVESVAETVALEADALACTTEEVPSVRLHVEDGGVPVDAELAQWRLRGGDTLQACDRTGVGEYLCGAEAAGELEVFAERSGERIASRVTVQQGECHVATVDVDLDFTPETCTDEFAFGVTVTTYDVDFAVNVDSVVWGLANSDMMPQPCDSFGDGIYGCAGETDGLIELTAVLGDETLVQTVEVLQGECHVLGETAGFVFGVTR